MKKLTETALVLVVALIAGYGDGFATCSETTMDGIGECGAVESHKPAGMYIVNECLQCIREY